MWTDGHIHLTKSDDELCQVIAEKDIYIMASFGTPEQCRTISDYKHIHMKATVGLHPWYSEQYSIKDMLPYMDDAAIIGEIGMDSVWCKVPLTIQQEAFIQQLQYAREHRKPVVLHTKGQEKNIAEIIAKYPNTYLVHWYSSMKDIDQYLELDCYFTVGPDLDDPAVQQVIKKVRLERLLVESDGLSAISWALHKEVSAKDYVQVLNNSLSKIAEIKKRPIDDVKQQIFQNFIRFINAGGK